MNKSPLLGKEPAQGSSGPGRGVRGSKNSGKFLLEYCFWERHLSSEGQAGKEGKGQGGRCISICGS